MPKGETLEIMQVVENVVSSFDVAGIKTKMSLPDGLCRHPSTPWDAIVLLANSCARRYSGPAAAGVEKSGRVRLLKPRLEWLVHVKDYGQHHRKDDNNNNNNKNSRSRACYRHFEGD